MKSATQPAYYFSANPLKAVKQSEVENPNGNTDLKNSTTDTNNGTLPAIETSLTGNKYPVIPNNNVMEDIERQHLDWYNNYE